MRKHDTLSGVGIFVQELASVQAQGPIAYTQYDFLKHYAGILSLIKFVAHVFSLPLMVFLRKDMGARYVDPFHVCLAFIIWQTAGLFSLGASELMSEIASPLINFVAWIFIPVAFWHQHRARLAALRGDRYSYDPGQPRLAALVPRIPRIRHLPSEVIPGFVRRWIDPTAISLLGVVCMALGISTGFGMFLIWTAILLHADEMLTQRSQWEMYLDMVDSQVLAEEKQRILSGEPGSATTPAFSLASVANVKGLTQPSTE